MKTFAKLLMGVTMFGIMLFPVFALESKKFDFKNETLGAESKAFSALVGDWRIDKDGLNLVYAVDGRKRVTGLSAGAHGHARDLYGQKSAEFLKGIEPLRDYPLTVCKEFQNFKNGALTVSFKAISGKGDQAAGIAFNIRQNGEYLAIEANALENNLGLFKFERGKRSPLQWAQDVPPPERGWHTPKVVNKGKKIEGYLDNKKYIDYTYEDTIDGRIGLWSKADSYVLFDNFTVQPL
jgi:hypothetical protein